MGPLGQFPKLCFWLLSSVFENEQYALQGFEFKSNNHMQMAGGTGQTAAKPIQPNILILLVLSIGLKQFKAFNN